MQVVALANLRRHASKGLVLSWPGIPSTMHRGQGFCSKSGFLSVRGLSMAGQAIQMRSPCLRKSLILADLLCQIFWNEFCITSNIEIRLTQILLGFLYFHATVHFALVRGHGARCTSLSRPVVILSFVSCGVSQKNKFLYIRVQFVTLYGSLDDVISFAYFGRLPISSNF